MFQILVSFNSLPLRRQQLKQHKYLQQLFTVNMHTIVSIVHVVKGSAQNVKVLIP